MINGPFIPRRPQWWGWKVVALTIGMIVSLIAFEEVVDDVFDDIPQGDDEAHQLDVAVATRIRSLESPSLTQLMTDITALGSVSVLVTVGIALLGVLVTRRDHQGLLHFCTAGFGALIIPGLLKGYFDRDRPELFPHLVDTTTQSFPSGHAFGATTIYLFVVLRVLNSDLRPIPTALLAIYALLLIVLIGISRIYLGVHHATDVLAGMAAGSAWSFFVAIVFEFISRRRIVV